MLLFFVKERGLFDCKTRPRMRIMVATLEQLCETIHQELDRLPVFKTKPTSVSTVPKDGIYFWYEDGEVRVGNQGQRVTRVGLMKDQAGYTEESKNIMD